MDINRRSRRLFRDVGVLFRDAEQFCSRNPLFEDLLPRHAAAESPIQLRVYYRAGLLPEAKFALAHALAAADADIADVSFTEVPESEAATAERIAQGSSVYIANFSHAGELELSSALLQSGVWVVQRPEQVLEWLSFDAPFDTDSLKRRVPDFGRVWYAIAEVQPAFVPRLHIGFGSKLYRPYISHSGDAAIRIGTASYISVRASFFLDADFSLGNFCQVSTDFTAVTRRHAISSLSLGGVGGGAFGYFGRAVDHAAPVQVGNDVWIGTRVIVLPGVVVGDGAVVGAGSVVTRNCEPYGVYAGNPAKFVRWRFDEATRQALLASQWWHWGLDKIYRNRLVLSENIERMSGEQVRQLLMGCE